MINTIIFDFGDIFINLDKEAPIIAFTKLGLKEWTEDLDELNLSFEKGKISENYNEEKLKEYMEWDSILITVDLKQGKEEFECYTCDFTHDYININAEYRRS